MAEDFVDEYMAKKAKDATKEEMGVAEKVYENCKVIINMHEHFKQKDPKIAKLIAALNTSAIINCTFNTDECIEILDKAKELIINTEKEAIKNVQTN